MSCSDDSRCRDRYSEGESHGDSEEEDDDAAGENLINWAQDGQTTGHDFVGQRVALCHGGEIIKGTITKWLPENVDADDEPAIFHVDHDDGDAEDLDEKEAEAAIAQLEALQMSAKQRGKRKAKAAPMQQPPAAEHDPIAPAGSTLKPPEAPPKRRPAPAADEDEDEDVEVAGQRGSVALADFPHAREHCLNCPFAPGSEAQHCENCFCFVCDDAASRCSEWSTHCKAIHSSAEWQQQRQQRKLARSASAGAAGDGGAVDDGGAAGGGRVLWSYDRMMEAVQQVFPQEESEPVGLANDIQLRPYQRQSLSFVLQMERNSTKPLAGRRVFGGSPLSLVRGGWVCDEVGMGKTAVAIAAVLANPSSAPRPSDSAYMHHEYAKYKTTLIVVPSTLVQQWEDEIRRFAPHLKVRRAARGRASLPHALPSSYSDLSVSSACMCR